MKKLTALFLTLALSTGAMSFSGITFDTHKASAAPERAVFVLGGGTGDGMSAESPVGTLEAAYAKLGDEGGKVVICGKLTMTGHFEEPIHTGTVTVTQNHNDLDYRDAGALETGGVGRRYILNGPTVFENIKITTANKGGFFIVGQFNRVELGEGIESVGFDGSQVKSALAVLGGTQNDLTPKKNNDTDSHIIVKSGSEVLVAGLTRQISADNDRSALIEIYGGQITTLYAGNINGGKGKSATVNISGGRFTGKVACEYGLAESVSVNIMGGDFSSCKSITGTAINSEITVAQNVENSVTPLISGFKKVTTSKGSVLNKIPDEVFGAGSFTASDGTKLPYREYYPEGYDSSSGKYPIFVYFHGNGSRGTDNKAQLGSNHAIVSKMLNSGTDCIIIAPQAPKESAWILNGQYPGGTGFDNTKEPTSKYLSAAIELINEKMSDPKVDRDRLYIAGGSNGAGACWSIISRNPRSVAAAVIQAGTGDTGGADKISKPLSLTPIWTFHGDADTTLSVNGTRGIVNAVNALGTGLLKYTEMPGRNHDIWVDAANEAGLIDWVLSQKRTDTAPSLSKVLDVAQLNAPSVDTTAPEVTTPIPSVTTSPDTTATPETAAPPETTVMPETAATPKTTVMPDTSAVPDTTGPADTSKDTEVASDGADGTADTALDNADTQKKGVSAWIPVSIGVAVLAAAGAAIAVIIKKKKK